MPKRNDKDKNDKRRIDTLSDSHPAKSLPKSDKLLISCFDKLGHCDTGDMGGVKPLSWQEIQSFSIATALYLNWWECEQLMLMSGAYCNMHYKAKKHGCKAPYQKIIIGQLDAIQSLHDEVDRQLDAFFK